MTNENTHKSDISIPNNLEIVLAISKVESFISSIRNISSTISSFNTEGLDLNGLDADVVNLQSNITNLIEDGSEINETYETLKNIYNQLENINNYETLFENNTYLKKYKDLFAAMTQDDCFENTEDFTKVIDEYRLELQEKNNKLEELVKKYPPMARTKLESDQEYIQLNMEIAGLYQAISVFGYLKSYNYENAYRMYMKNEDYEENSISRIAYCKNELVVPAEIWKDKNGNLCTINTREDFEKYLKAEGYTEKDIEIQLLLYDDRAVEQVVYYDKDGNILTDIDNYNKALFFAQTGQNILKINTLYSDVIVDPNDLRSENLQISNYLENTFSYLTQDETGILTYLYNSGNTERLNSYVEYLNNKANIIHGYSMAKELTENIDEYYDNSKSDVASYVKTLGLLFGTGIDDGLNMFTDGIANLFIADGEKSADDYKKQFLTEYINELFGEEKVANWIATATYNVSTGVGNMIPSVAVSMLGFEGLGLGMMGLSATGNYRETGLQYGLNNGGAWLYAVLNGSSEVALQYLLGGIANMGKGELADAIVRLTNMPYFLASMGSEGIEESTQEALEPLFLYIASGGKIAHKIDLKDVATAGIYGAITAGIINGGQLMINGISYPITNEIIPTLIDKFGGENTDLTNQSIQEELISTLTNENPEVANNTVDSEREAALREAEEAAISMAAEEELAQADNERNTSDLLPPTDEQIGLLEARSNDQNQVDDLEGQLEQTENARNALLEANPSISPLDTSMIKLNKTIDYIKEQLVNLRSKITQIDIDLSKYNNEYADSRESLLEARSNNQNQVDDLEGQLEQTENARNALLETNPSISPLDTSMIKLNKAIDFIKERLAKFRSNITEIDSKLNDIANRELTELNEKNAVDSEREAALREAEEAATSMAAEEELAQADNERNASNLAETNENTNINNESEQQIANESNELGNNDDVEIDNESITPEENQNSTPEEDHTDIKNRLESDKNELQQKLEELKERLNDKEKRRSEIDKYSNEAQRLYYEIEHINDSIERIESQINDIDTRLSDIIDDFTNKYHFTRVHPVTNNYHRDKVEDDNSQNINLNEYIEKTNSDIKENLANENYNSNNQNTDNIPPIINNYQYNNHTQNTESILTHEDIYNMIVNSGITLNPNFDLRWFYLFYDYLIEIGISPKEANEIMKKVLSKDNLIKMNEVCIPNFSIKSKDNSIYFFEYLKSKKQTITLDYVNNALNYALIDSGSNIIDSFINRIVNDNYNDLLYIANNALDNGHDISVTLSKFEIAYVEKYANTNNMINNNELVIRNGLDETKIKSFINKYINIS